MINNYEYLVRLSEEAKKMETTVAQMYCGLLYLVCPVGPAQHKLYKDILLEVDHIETQLTYLRRRLSDLALMRGGLE